MGLMDTLKGVVGGNTHEGTQADAKAAGAHDQSHLVDKTDKDITGAGGSNLTNRYGMGEGGVSQTDRLADQATTRIGDNSTSGVNPGHGQGFMSTRDERDTIGNTTGHHGEQNPIGHSSGRTGLTGGTAGIGGGGLPAEPYRGSESTGSGVGGIGSGQQSTGFTGGQQDYNTTGGSYADQSRSGQGHESSTRQVGSGIQSGQGYESSTQQVGSGEGHHHHGHHHDGHEHHERDSGNTNGVLGMGSLNEAGKKPGHTGEGGRAGGFDGAGEGYADGNMGAGYTEFQDNSPISGTGSTPNVPGFSSSGHSHGHHHGHSHGDNQSSGQYSTSGGENYSSGNQSSGQYSSSGDNHASGNQAGKPASGLAGVAEKVARKVAPGQFDESRNNA